MNVHKNSRTMLLFKQKSRMSLNIKIIKSNLTSHCPIKKQGYSELQSSSLIFNILLISNVYLHMACTLLKGRQDNIMVSNIQRQ